MAIALAEAGADVVCHGNSRSPQETCKRIEKLGRVAAGVQADLAQSGAAETTAALQHDESRNRQILERIPAQRWGEPADICGAAVFLASAASDYVQGHVLVVDGGWMGR